MTFPYNIKINKCIGSCDNITNPYARAYFPDIVENVSVKVFNLISQQNETRQIFLHICILNETVCNNKQKWNKDECRCECLKTKKCDDDIVWNINNCECEYGKKAAKLTTGEECEEINNDSLYNKTILTKEMVEDCKPFVASSIFFPFIYIGWFDTYWSA